MRLTREQLAQIALLLFLLLSLGLMRARLYGNFGLSVGMPDTSSYIESPTVPLMSWQSFTGRRLFTMNLLYKIANDQRDCPLSTVSFPAAGEESIRSQQACFSKIAVIQNLLSIFSWCLLAWTISKWLSAPTYKVLGILITLTLALTPQIAE